VNTQGVSQFDKGVSRRLGTVAFLGFSSGLPLALTGSTLQAWMSVEGVDLKTIGLFSLVGLPYTLKFLWAPVLDRFLPPLLGRRRGWLLLIQAVLIVLIFALALSSPAQVPEWVFVLALVIAFVSASQDIVVDAYRTDVLKERERGLGAAVSVTGYRLAMLVSGALALVLSEQIGWHATYLFAACLLTVGIAGALFGPEPEEPGKPPQSLKEAVTGPLIEFFSRPGAGAILVLIIFYKLGDAFAGSLTTVFLNRAAGFSMTEIGAINKGLGLSASIIGALAGGALMARLGLFRALLLYGILQAVSNLSFAGVAVLGRNFPMMVFSVAFENLAGGMGTAAFVALLMTLCDHRFSATQFALLSAMAALGRVYVGPPSAYLVDFFGWTGFFITTFLIALPGLFLLWALRDRIRSLEHGNSRTASH
jgi:PAT family beta-lactamase induction signal transducer AmpG